MEENEDIGSADREKFSRRLIVENLGVSMASIPDTLVQEIWHAPLLDAMPDLHGKYTHHCDMRRQVSFLDLTGLERLAFKDFGELNTEIQTLKNSTLVIVYSGLLQGQIKNDFFNALDIGIESQMHKNELKSVAEVPEFEYEEPPRKKKQKQAGEEVLLE